MNPVTTVAKNRNEEIKFAALRQLDEIKALDPVEFERFVGFLFEHMGYSVTTTSISGDEGIDLWIEKDAERSIVQCKRFDGQVGQPVVRDLYGEMVSCMASRAYLVTTGIFSVPAQAWATGKSIILVDGSEILEWLGYVVPPPLPISNSESKNLDQQGDGFFKKSSRKLVVIGLIILSFLFYVALMTFISSILG
jgi:restriction endonuclease Mrr